MNLDFDFLGIGFGPMHLALACSLHDTGHLSPRTRFLEQKIRFSWHSGLQFAGSAMQTPFLKDLASLRDPTSPFTFVSYLKEKGRLETFIENRILYPSRAEFEDYFLWAANKLHDFVSYESEVLQVHPISSAGAELAGFRVLTKSGGSLTCKHLSVAAGLSARDFRAVSEKHLHVSSYQQEIAKLVCGRGQGAKAIVIGGGQSAGEVTLDLLRRAPDLQISVVSRGFVFRSVEANPFVNGLFSQPSHDAFRPLPLEVRQKQLDDLKLSNYGAVDEAVISQISLMLYSESLQGVPRLHRESYASVGNISCRPDGMVELRIDHLHTKASSIMTCDFVIDCRGFDSAIAAKMLAPLDGFFPMGKAAKVELDECYAASALSGRGNAKLFLHGYGDYFVDTTMICNIANRAEAVQKAIFV